MSDKLHLTEKDIAEAYQNAPNWRGVLRSLEIRHVLAQPIQPETNGEALSENVRKAFEGEFHVSVDQEYDGYVQVRVGTEFASDEQAEFVERAIRAALAATGGKRVSS